MITEHTSCKEDHIEFTKITVSDLIDELNELYPNLKTLDFQVAINNKIVDKESRVTEKEIALLPPFSGG